MGALMLDRDDPTKVIHKCENFLMTPQEIYEVVGHTPNVVFPTNVLIGEDGKMAIYYGQSVAYWLCESIANATGKVLFEAVSMNIRG